jgi:hypothetical protein
MFCMRAIFQKPDIILFHLPAKHLTLIALTSVKIKLSYSTKFNLNPLHSNGGKQLFLTAGHKLYIMRSLFSKPAYKLTTRKSLP